PRTPPPSLHAALPICLQQQQRLGERVGAWLAKAACRHLIEVGQGKARRRVRFVTMPLSNPIAGGPRIDRELRWGIVTNLTRRRADRKSTRLNSSHVKI